MRRSTGFVVAAVIAGVGLVVGVAIAILAGSRLDGLGDLVPDLREIEADGTPMSITMRPGREWKVFAQDPDIGAAPAVTCEGDGVTVRDPSSAFTVTLGGVEWERALILTVDRPGTYLVSCVAEPTSTAATPRLAMQDDVEPGAAGDLVTGVAGIAIGVGVVLVGLLAGGVVALVAAVQGRRSP